MVLVIPSGTVSVRIPPPFGTKHTNGRLILDKGQSDRCCILMVGGGRCACGIGRGIPIFRTLFDI